MSSYMIGTEMSYTGYAGARLRGILVYANYNNGFAVLRDTRSDELAIVDKWGAAVGWYGPSADKKARAAADAGRLL